LLGAAAINATGNGAMNVLVGNVAANILDGRGGADLMAGGKGADTYYVDDLADLVIEDVAGLAGGIDLVKSSVDFSLAALVNVEKLTLIGANHLDATGNALANLITGNDGNNRLDGLSGRDTLVGGRGDDTYVVDNIGDIVTESITNASGGGIDTVESSVGFTLATRVNVENLILTGSGNIAGTGNALANYLEGNAGNNRLDGGAGNDTVVGGAGNDTLLGGLGNDVLFGGHGIDTFTGGAGRDHFYYESLADAGDTITDFKLGATGDVLHLGDLLADLGNPADPFVEGFLRFEKSGANTLVTIDADGLGDASSPTTLVTLVNVTLTAANVENFDLAPSVL
jgi:Ca2+-binding RTX toxin-like protein